MDYQVKSIEDIKNILPHRYPFLLIDRVISIGEGRVVVIKNISINEPYFQGHFPERAIMPGVLQIEAMAQAAGLLFNSDDLGFLAGIEKARFKHPVVPGDQLKIEVNLLAHKQGVLKINGKASVDDKICCEAEITIVRSKT